MKKRFLVSLILLCLALSLASCGKNPNINESESSQEVVESESETGKAATLSEMSPDTMDTSLPDRLAIKVSDIDFDSFTEIKAKKSLFPEAQQDKILESDNAQYFFLDEDTKFQAVFYVLSENLEKNITASASYDTETGVIEFYAEADKTWYFDETGEITSVVYTFSFGSSTPSIYTFYSPDGEKDVTRTMDGWYSADFELLTQEEVLECLKKYEGTVEATKEYQSTSVQ